MRKSLILTGVVIGYIVVLFTATLAPARTLGKAYNFLGISGDNFLHFGAFFFLAFLLHMVFIRELYSLEHPLAWTFFVAVCFAVIGEVMQLTQSSRHGTLFDFVLNSSGITVYLILAKGVYWLRSIEYKAKTVDE